ncbi:ABC transporter permease [Cellulomonas sp. zg-ZUI222]|uniref:ABC transporter permease n=1 Tax=Cellulomonas wangleii TaxID=2816956 RepID=A0ABX8D564_9CELL|nr:MULTISPECIES: ABC transporter permease [Cellulomonas]MBO0898788.1 ABC transporter permease [Cellulomonas sp. zg-ZUI22]MBO0919650.1 ABC transporter permease [Cellulomonas wangleii]MBO0923924.1 ABC transporter permease [Cellulomonas wangleii]MBO0924206.1 ABC transporter permease [Cellulomonas wangleii]QVI62221.1 ABC transporter permease [Cellulomonas wangleii]
MSTTTRAAVPAPALRPWASLAWLHTRYQFLETVRVPLAVIGNMLFPGLALLFFVVPQGAIMADPLASTAAIAQLGTFAIMSACMFTHGAGVAEDRAQPFDTFVRTLPARPGPRLAGRVLNGLLWAYLALVPLVLIGVLLTSATLTPARALGAVAMVAGVAVPFTLLGMAIGFSMSTKAALAVTQCVLFPLAFAGGVFMPPEVFPGWLDAISQALPSRAARDLIVQVTTGVEGSPAALPVLLAWTAVLAALAVAAVRSDEGRRFR